MGTAVARRARPVTRALRTREEFDEAVAELDALALSDPRPGSAAYDRFELLAILVAAYEDERLPHFQNAAPQELVRFMAEQKGMTQSALAELLGGRSRLSEFFNGTRELSKSQIVRLRDGLGIPADLLLGG